MLSIIPAAYRTAIDISKVVHMYQCTGTRNKLIIGLENGKEIEIVFNDIGDMDKAFTFIIKKINDAHTL